MAGLSIPGVTDQYNTSETVEKLMKIERIPLTREQEQLENYKLQKDAWREINVQLSSLRDSTKTLYSYDNPFNNKLTTSTQEDAITAEANRSADFQSFKIDVIQTATTDRFLTDELAEDYQVKDGMYTFKVGDKQINLNWKGGSLKNFSEAINRRSNGVVKSMIIGSSSGKKTLLIESLTPGKENKLIFEGKAKEFALSTGMISPVKSETQTLGDKRTDLVNVQNLEKSSSRMPSLSLSNVDFTDNKITVNPRGAFQINLPANIKNDDRLTLSFTISQESVEDITYRLNQTAEEPIIPQSGQAVFNGISINNFDSDTLLPKSQTPPAPLDPIENKKVLYAVMDDGSQKEISISDLKDGEEKNINLSLKENKGIKAISLVNENTGKQYKITPISAYNENQNLGFSPNHAVSTADDAIIKYEGITITRPTNTIDDVIPEVTLNLHDKTEKTATIDIKPDTEASKNALIDFVGKYNQAVAKINILSQNKNDIIEELTYLSDDEKDKAREKLGLFTTDFSLTSIKSNMQNIVSTGYAFSDDAIITMLSQIGISTNASGFSGSYSQSRLRGYLEIDEKKLDSALENHLNDIKQMFGYDSDGDLIVDSGIAYALDKQIGAYTQTGGILALKTSNLDSRIKSSEQKISKLESQMDDKEASLRQKYSSMEGSLNSLESQQNAISNFSKQNSSGN